jgi:hypothetical protein
MSMDFAEILDVLSELPLRDVLRQHARTGEFEGCHLRMSSDTFAFCRDTTASPRRMPWEPDLGMLTGLSVVVDESVPFGSYRLRENTPPGDARRIGPVL